MFLLLIFANITQHNIPVGAGVEFRSCVVNTPKGLKRDANFTHAAFSQDDSGKISCVTSVAVAFGACL